MKYLLKKAIGDTVPDLILKRKDKMGFPVPLHIWTRNKAKPFMMDVLLSKKSKERGILNTKTIEKLITSEEPFSRGLWGLLSLELWYNQFMDN
jgi:asparagine synthase (glutamine-hydrolysing)